MRRCLCICVCSVMWLCCRAYLYMCSRACLCVNVMRAGDLMWLRILPDPVIQASWSHTRTLTWKKHLKKHHLTILHWSGFIGLKMFCKVLLIEKPQSWSKSPKIPQIRTECRPTYWGDAPLSNYTHQPKDKSIPRSDYDIDQYQFVDLRGWNCEFRAVWYSCNILKWKFSWWPLGPAWLHPSRPSGAQAVWPTQWCGERAHGKWETNGRTNGRTRRFYE